MAGAGLIGSRLADMAQDSGWKIRILHRSGPGRAPQKGLKVDASGREHTWWAPAEHLLAPEAILGRDLLRPGGLFILEHPGSYDFSTHPLFTEMRTYGAVHFSLFHAPKE